ncbi:hypothetical protein NHF45_09720 [Maricaulaceae bacterium NA33B04]|nr:hypothetical protein [Maricaulaceae bacterium NA33B04]
MEAENNTPNSISGAVALLEAHSAAGFEPSPPIAEGRLPHSVLAVLPAAFQPRALGDDVVSGPHVANLRKALEHRGKKALDPIVVFWSGKQWFIVDGHHRLEAYRTSKKWDGANVPVEAFQGTPREAVAEAVERNSKTTMPLLKTEKSDIGWKLVCLTDLKVKEVMAKADISSGTVKKMRARLRELLDKFPDRYTEQKLADQPWREVIKPTFGGPEEEREIDDEWEAKLAHDFRDRLRKEFGDKLTKCPDAFAMAIRLLHEGLPAMLMESPEWQDQRDARLDAWVEGRQEGYEF